MYIFICTQMAHQESYCLSPDPDDGRMLYLRHQYSLHPYGKERIGCSHDQIALSHGAMGRIQARYSYVISLGLYGVSHLGTTSIMRY